VATLILESLGIFPADGENEMHYYRKVLQIPRLPSRTWPEIERVTGYSRPVLYRHYRLLSLPDEFLYLATLYRIPEFALREIVTAPPEKQREKMESIIAEQSGSQAASDPDEAASPDESKHNMPAASLTRKRAERLLLALRPLIKQSQADGGYKQIAGELSALLEPDGRKVVAAAFRNLAQGMER